MREKEIKRVVDIRLAPSAVFVIIQILLVHYKLTSILPISWWFVLSPLVSVGLIGLLGIFYNLIINLIYHLNRPGKK
jgi:hypothetical protein